MNPDRWEMGSLFHLAEVPPGEVRAAWANHPHALFASGRDALRWLLSTRPPGRLLVPSFFCQDVVRSLVEVVQQVVVYADSPLQPAPAWADIPLQAGDAVLRVAYFGVRSAGGGGPVPDGVTVIEDHTHGPCGAPARASEADFCIASLRKLWPLADGGALWSPRAHPVPDPPEVSADAERASGIKLAGMVLKAQYLGGEHVEKATFRELLDRGERGLYGPHPSGITPWSRALLDTIPFESLEQARRARFARLVAALPGLPGYEVLHPAAPGLVPFSAFFVFDRAGARDAVHRDLVDQRVYASGLWPLDDPLLPGVPEAHRDLARRSFSVPVDVRYTLADMDVAATRIAAALRRWL